MHKVLLSLESYNSTYLEHAYIGYIGEWNSEEWDKI